MTQALSPSRHLSFRAMDSGDPSFPDELDELVPRSGAPTDEADAVSAPRAPTDDAVGAVWDALRGALVTRALALAAQLGVARALTAGPRSVDELARGGGADPDTLYRVLRALASDGIFEETEPRFFRNTGASEVLARDGWDDFAHLFGGAWLQAVAALDASGEPSFERVHGSELWAWFAAHPRERAAFDRAMAQGPDG